MYSDFNISSQTTHVPIAVDIDFYDLFRKFEARYQNCYIFESLGEESHLSRYSIIGFDPDAIYSARGKCLSISKRGDQSTEQIQTKNPYYDLRRIIPQNVVSRGYVGGLTGFLSYEAAEYFEPTLKLKKNDLFEQFKFGLYTDGILLDKATNEILYFYTGSNRESVVREVLQSNSPAPGNLEVEPLGSSMTEQEHREAVEKVKGDISEGLIFQCEVGFKTKYKIIGDTTQIYDQLRATNPSPQMYYVKFGDQKLIGASPELLFRLRQGEMETYPLAGTVSRGRTHKEDKALARSLLGNEKESAEHRMIVDLHRNDIGRVARFGTVKIRNLMDIRRYSHVQHIASDIVGVIDPNHDMFSALASCFPAGTLTGAPKIEAMKIIDELEQDGRGPYGGAVGTFSFNGDCTFAIPIRSIFISDSSGYVQTCGGNVYDSVPREEYEEIQRKFAAMKRILREFEV